MNDHTPRAVNAATTPATPVLTRSLSAGPTDVPLIAQTLGDFFDGIVARWPQQEALVSVHQRQRYTYNAPASSPARCWDWGCSRASALASGRTTMPSGC